jgi:hypothetical protein
MRESNPLMDLLIAYYQQTSPRKPSSPPVEEKRVPTPNAMRSTKGPIKAEKARKYASQRERMMSQIP